MIFKIFYNDKNLKKKMDELEITLFPCLNKIKLYKLKYLSGIVDCIVCGDHKIDVENCMNCLGNKLKINQKKIELEMENLYDGRNKLSQKDYLLRQKYLEINSKIDVSKEKLKIDICQKIDEIASDLKSKLEKDKNKIETNIFQLFFVNIQKKIGPTKDILFDFLSVKKQLESTEIILKKINDELQSYENVEKDLKDIEKLNIKEEIIETLEKRIKEINRNGNQQMEVDESCDDMIYTTKIKGSECRQNSMNEIQKVKEPERGFKTPQEMKPDVKAIAIVKQENAILNTPFSFMKSKSENKEFEKTKPTLFSITRIEPNDKSKSNLLGFCEKAQNNEIISSQTFGLNSGRILNFNSSSNPINTLLL